MVFIITFAGALSFCLFRKQGRDDAGGQQHIEPRLYLPLLEFLPCLIVRHISQWVQKCLQRGFCAAHIIDINAFFAQDAFENGHGTFFCHDVAEIFDTHGLAVVESPEPGCTFTMQHQGKVASEPDNALGAIDIGSMLQQEIRRFSPFLPRYTFAVQDATVDDRRERGIHLGSFVVIKEGVRIGTVGNECFQCGQIAG